VAAEVPREASVVDDGRRETTGAARGFNESPIAVTMLGEAPRGADARWPCTDNENTRF
jgi:hypothetical protein